MKRMSSISEGLRRMISSAMPAREESFSPYGRRVSGLGSLQGGETSTGFRRWAIQDVLRDVLTSERESATRPTSTRDPLPTDPTNLEGLQNFHIGQLERIKREVEFHNESIAQMEYTWNDAVQYSDLRNVAECLNARIQGLRNTRNRLAKFVLFHLHELDRIEEELDKLRGGQGAETDK